MRKRFLILFLLVSAVVYGQTPAGYIKANMRFKWTAGIFDSALHVPQYSGTPSGTRNGAWVGDGAVAIDTVNNLFYFRSGGSWHSTSSGAGWLLTGNSGTTSSNFIGTTDNQPLSFRVNNRWAGRIYTNGSVFIGDSSGVNNSALNNAGFGRYSLYNNTTGSYNTGSGAYSLYGNTTGVDNTGSGAYSLYINTSGESNTGSGAYSLYGNTTGGDNTGSGAYSLYSNTTGWDNTGSGAYSLYNNTSGEGNTGSGAYSLYSNSSGESNTGSGVYSLRNNTTGSNNTGMGYAAGYNAKQKVDAVHQILIGAETYGTRDSISVIGANFIKETIVRGKLIDSTLSAGAGTNAVRWNSSTGEFTYADTTAGGATPAGSNKQVQYNNSGAFGGATGVEIGNTDERLTVTSQATSEAALTVKQVGQYVGINIKPTDASYPYSPVLTFSQTVNSVSAKMGLDYGVFRIEGGFNPYGLVNQQEVAFGSFYSGLENFRVHTYVADVPASPDDWTTRVRTPKTAAVGQVIDWGAAGQTGDLLQFRDNSAAVLASVTSAGNIKAPAPTYSSGGYKFLVRNSTSSQFESIDPLVGSSTYTPTTSGLTNVDSTHVFECQYSWITDATTGLKTVTVSGQVEVYINSANTDSHVILSLPVASSFANEYEAGGSGGVTSASNGLSNHRYSIGVMANTISEAADFVFNPTSGSCNAKINFSFHYKVNTP